jgi:dsDNA-specific endonuclease/ATPase MutS2
MIQLVNARHPQLGTDAVPLNLSLGNHHKGIVITGPNTGGKTVVLKTVGLLTLMAMCGLLIPADKESRLSVFEHILADIGDGQSITQNLSTFSSHIKNINQILELSNDNSLVLLDEVGSGTEPNEGAGIAVAILELLFEKNTTIMATTHYSQLKAFAKDTNGFINGSMLFDAESLNPLYQIQLGEAGKSHALLIALKLGMNMAVLDRAHQITYNQAFDQKAYADMAHLKEAKEVKIIKEVREESQSVIAPVKRPSKTLLFKTGDSVYIPFMKASGIILGDPNKKGEYPVEIKGKRFSLSHKRITPFIEQKDLYPEDYDLDIVTKSVDRRKTEKKMKKGKQGFVVVHRGE